MIVLIANLIFVSCQTLGPEEVAGNALNCLVKKNYRGYVDYFYIENENVSKINDQKNLVADFVRKMSESSYEPKGGLKSYKISNSTTKDKIVTVKYELTFGNGTTIPEDSLRLKKNVEGEWRLLFKRDCKWDDVVELVKAWQKIIDLSDKISNEAVDSDMAVAVDSDMVVEESGSTLDVAEIIQQYVACGKYPFWDVYNSNKSLTAMSDGLESEDNDYVPCASCYKYKASLTMNNRLITTDVWDRPMMWSIILHGSNAGVDVLEVDGAMGDYNDRLISYLSRRLQWRLIMTMPEDNSVGIYYYNYCYIGFAPSCGTSACAPNIFVSRDKELVKAILKNYVY